MCSFMEMQKQGFYCGTLFIEDGGMAQTKICHRVGCCGFISNLNTKTHYVFIHGNAEAGIPCGSYLEVLYSLRMASPQTLPLILKGIHSQSCRSAACSCNDHDSSLGGYQVILLNAMQVPVCPIELVIDPVYCQPS